MRKFYDALATTGDSGANVNISTAKELLENCENSLGDTELYNDTKIIKAFKIYAQEAIKADRLNLLNHVCLTEFAQEFLQEEASDAIDKNSILNAPNITLL